MTTGHEVENVSWVSCLNSLAAKRLHKKMGNKRNRKERQGI